MKRLSILVATLLFSVSALAQNGVWVGMKNIQFEKKNKYCTYTVKGEYPDTQNSVVSNAIREWINETLGGSFTGDLADYQKMLSYYADAAIKEYSTPDMAEIVSEFGVTSSVYFEFKRAHETAKVITFNAIGEYYSAGAAHGMPFDVSTTFRKSDGRRFEWSMFTSDAISRLKPIIAKKLRTDYGDEAFFKIPSASDPDFGLPGLDPYVGKDGVVFTYTPYEIAPYSFGFITVTLPLSMIKSMLNASGQTFLAP